MFIINCAETKNTFLICPLSSNDRSSLHFFLNQANFNLREAPLCTTANCTSCFFLLLPHNSSPNEMTSQFGHCFFPHFTHTPMAVEDLAVTTAANVPSFGFSVGKEVTLFVDIQLLEVRFQKNSIFLQSLQNYCTVLPNYSLSQVISCLLFFLAFHHSNSSIIIMLFVLTCTIHCYTCYRYILQFFKKKKIQFPEGCPNNHFNVPLSIRTVIC